MKNIRKNQVKLTSLSSCAGCAAKLGQDLLAQLLRNVPQYADARLLVGAATGDDAGVYRIARDLALVQTVDFFTPIVDDPFTYGEIAATNAISDVYAMGGRPITALNIVGMPDEALPPEVMAQILRGGAEKAKEAKCTLLGGHTIRIPEPVYGMAVTGLVSPRRMITNAAARPGDWLILTKPLGTGVITTAIKRGLAPKAASKSAIASMTRLNTVGAELAETGLVRAGTDVTGFGVLGHLASMCRASRVGAELYWANLPVLHSSVLELIERGCVPGGSKKNLETANRYVGWNNTPELFRALLADAQTSGGLLLCVKASKLSKVLALLKQQRALSAAIIGRIIESNRLKITVMERHENGPPSGA